MTAAVREHPGVGHVAAAGLFVQHAQAQLQGLADQRGQQTLDAAVVQAEAVDGAAARVAVRFDEVFESIRLLRTLLAQLPDGPIRTDVALPAPGATGLGWVEGWRGDVLVALDAAADGRIHRLHPHDPSWQNWPLLERAVLGNIVPDFPLINKSFNLSYSGQDL